MNQIKVIQVGLGPLGQKIVQFINQRKGIEIIGAVDVAPHLKGKDVGEHCGLGEMGIQIQDSVSVCLASLKDQEPDAAILTTVSSMEKITPQIEQIVGCGLPVVSTCEELLCPWHISKELSERIDHAAKANQVAVLGTGVNPGFLMDSLPVFLTAVCQDVKKITVNRIQDAACRRVPFQKKIGAGLTLEQFEKKKAQGTLRHIGLTESLHLIASSVGWQLTQTEDILTPVIAQKKIITEAMQIPVGHAAGVQQIGNGYMNGDKVVSLIFRAAVGEPDPVDSIEIEGNPSIKSIIGQGVHGDIATCAITINAIKRIVKAPPGLRTMADIPLVSFFQ
jgi:4-hydroxy-tetrahydrodipicolinate reductase